MSKARLVSTTVFILLMHSTLCCSQDGQSLSQPALAPAGSVLSLEDLSDEELLDLYATTFQESLRGQVFDVSSLAQWGYFLLQTGYTFSYDRDELEFRTIKHTVPEFLVRYRLLNRLELRAAWAGVTFEELSDELTGVSDWDTRIVNPSIGIRFGLWPQNGILPRTAVSISTPYDLNATGNLTDRLNPLAGVGYSWLIEKKALFSASSGAIWNRQGSSRYLDFRQSFSYAWFVNEKLDMHVTWAGLFPEGSRIDGLNHSMGPGISYSMNRKVQWDMIGSFGLDEHSPDFVTQFFVTWRL